MATGERESVELTKVQLAQTAWAKSPVSSRIAVIRRLRHSIAQAAQGLAETVPTRLPGALNRTVADTLVSEVIPLLEACRFLEQNAGRILKTKRLGRRGRPLFLGRLDSRVERVPLGVVLVLGAANYPLFLAGVQVIQALVAGNAVLWKPAPATEGPAIALRRLLAESGLPAALLTVLDSRVDAATEAIAAGVDHVVLTGSAETGKVVLRQLAETLTPATMELSGCDAVYVLPDADLEQTVCALAFGLRLNGSCTCMAPRRVFLVGFEAREAEEFEGRLAAALGELAVVPLPQSTERLLRELLEDAELQNAEIRLDSASCGAALILAAKPSMRSMQTDVFAPILSVMRTANINETLAASAACPYALTASIFGPEREARLLAEKLRVGTVLINDVIIPTVDPRVPFGGRGRSGFGVTRGAEGLLAMTSPRVVQVQRTRSKRNYEAATSTAHVDLFAGLAEVLHGTGIRARWSALRRIVKAARRLGNSSNSRFPKGE